MPWKFIAAVILTIVSILLTPKPKTPKRAAARDLEAPTGDAGRPIPKLFGTMTITSPNVLWYGDQQIATDKVKL